MFFDRAKSEGWSTQPRQINRARTHDNPVPPRGTKELSPPFQRWESSFYRSRVPAGTTLFREGAGPSVLRPIQSSVPSVSSVVKSVRWHLVTKVPSHMRFLLAPTLRFCDAIHVARPTAVFPCQIGRASGRERQ